MEGIYFCRYGGIYKNINQGGEFSGPELEE
jgi:hypothetical protein